MQSQFIPKKFKSISILTDRFTNFNFFIIDFDESAKMRDAMRCWDGTFFLSCCLNLGSELNYTDAIWSEQSCLHMTKKKTTAVLNSVSPGRKFIRSNFYEQRTCKVYGYGIYHALIKNCPSIPTSISNTLFSLLTFTVISRGWPHNVGHTLKNLFCIPSRYFQN